jgi:cytidylate kinase
MKPLLITIDGPAGAGKTTVSRMLANRLGYRYVDTGALYRAVAYMAQRHRIDATDEAGLAELCPRLRLRFELTTQGQRLLVNDEDIEDQIRTPEIAMRASAVSGLAVVRDFLLSIQRRLGQDKAAVFEGRDMGTVVFPDADVKFFLNASSRIRARRRQKQYPSEAQRSLDAIETDIERRDTNDSQRALAPLKPAADAIHVNTDMLDADGVVALMCRHIDTFRGKSPPQK